MLKRSCDIVLSTLALLSMLPLFLLAAFLIKLESRGPVFFRQIRVGKDFSPFTILKFRTMLVAETREGFELTCGDDDRITKFGALLRRTKMDEIPQLWNVLCGEMSFVGPRPQTPALVEQMRDHYSAILRVRPGITDLASLHFRSESEILGMVDNPVEYYLRVIMPDKMRLQYEYLQRQSFLLDLWLIWCTVLVCLGSERNAERIGRRIDISYLQRVAPDRESSQAWSRRLWES